MASPALIGVLAIIVYPLAFATYYSLREVSPNLVGEFVGLTNYAGLAQDSAFTEALFTTLLFTAASTVLSFLAGLGLALLLARPFPGRGALAAAVFLPWIFPTVVTATFGRMALGFSNGGLLLGDRSALFVMAVLVDVWRSAPFVALLLLAGLATIPRDIYEAASVEGASSLQKFFKITLPLLKPTILIVLLIRLLDAFRVHDLFWVMGGRQLVSLSTYVYQNVLLSAINFGRGSAAAVFVFACALSVALVFAVILRAQASTGLGQEGLAEDPNELAGSYTGARSGFSMGITSGLLAIAFLAPVAWVFWLSVTPSLDLYGSREDGSGASPSLLLYSFMLSDGQVVTSLVNSAVIAGVTTALTLVLACPAAYAIARLGLRYGNSLLGAMLAVAFFPPAAVLVPMLVQLREIGIVGTQLGVIVPHTVFFLPFAVWLLAMYFRELPAEVEDAARVDGALETQVLTRVVLPLAAPAVFATGAFIFVLSWNEFVFASTFTYFESSPITVVLADLVTGMSVGAPPGPLAAASLLATLPPIILFLTFRRRILSGLTGDALGETTDDARGSRTWTLPKAGVRVATAVLLLTQVWAITLFVRYGAGALSFPYPLNYGEGPLLDQAVRILDLQNIYPADLSEPPFTISNYPPLFVLVQAPLVWLFGPEYWYGRAISLAGAVATAVFIALTLHVLTRDRIASVASGLSFLAVPYVVQWSSFSRVDLLGLALSWAGLYLVVRQPDRRRYLIAAALLMVAAIYTRQTYALAAPLASLAWLLSRRQLREALTLAAVVGGVSLVILGALSAMTGGGFFFHTVTSNVNEFRWEQVTFYLSGLIGLLPVMLAGGVAFLVLSLRSRVESRWLVGPYLLGAVATALLIGKVGSDVNYLLELCAALALAVGALLARYAKRPAPRAAMLLVLAVQMVLMVQTSQLYYAGLKENIVARKDEISRLEEIVDGSEGPVLADEYMGLLPLEGRRIYLQPFEMTQLAREERWDQDPLLRDIRQTRFSAILIFEPPGARWLVEDRWTEEMLEQIEAHYEPEDTFALTRVYLPKE